VSPQQWANCRDVATIALLEETGHSGDPREYLADCLGCAMPFWVRVGGAYGGCQRYCGEACRLRYWYAARRRAAGRARVAA